MSDLVRGTLLQPGERVIRLVEISGETPRFARPPQLELVVLGGEAGGVIGSPGEGRASFTKIY